MHIEPTAFAVYPDRYEDLSEMGRWYWRVMVESRGGGVWCVKDSSFVATKTGRWVYEPQPSSRTDAFKRRTRFDLPTAIGIATKVVRCRTVNGMTIDQWIERTREVTP
jgi:hypothetical protein